MDFGNNNIINTSDKPFFSMDEYDRMENSNVFYFNTDNLEFDEIKNKIKSLTQKHAHFIKIGEGGEGVVFENIDNRAIIKIYKKHKDNPERFKKLELMKSVNVEYDGICWPQEVFKIGRRNAFQTVKALGGDLFLLLRKPKMETYEYIDRRYLIRLSIDLLKKIKYLHNLDILIGDINLMNIIVDTPNCKTHLIDSDSFQIGNFNCPVGSVTFTPPELQGKNFNTTRRSKENEYFAIASLIFIIFHAGQAPYNYIGGEGPEKNIRNKHFPYPYGLNTTDRAPKGFFVNMWTMLSEDMKKAFYDAFKLEKRPTPSDWIRILSKYNEEIIDGTCQKEVFPDRMRTIQEFVNTEQDSNIEERIGSSNNVVNKNGTRFGIVEMSSKAVKFITVDTTNADCNTFDFNNFSKETLFTNTRRMISNNNIMSMQDFENQFIPKVKGFIDKQIEDFNIKHLYIYGGAPFRAAKNKENVFGAFQKHIGLQYQIMTQADESLYNLKAYLLSQNLDYINCRVALFEWGQSSFRISIYEGKNKLIQAETFNDLGAAVLRRIFFQNNEPGKKLENALIPYDHFIVKQCIEEIYSKISLNNIDKYICLGDPFKNIVGGGNLKSCHLKVIDKYKIDQAMKLYIDKIKIPQNYGISDSGITILDLKLNTTANAPTASNQGLHKKLLKVRKFNRENLESRLIQPIILDLFDKYKIGSFVFSGTGVWFGLYRHINEQIS